MPPETPCPFCHMGLRYDLELGADVLCEYCNGTGFVEEEDFSEAEEAGACGSGIEKHRDEEVWEEGKAPQGDPGEE